MADREAKLRIAIELIQAGKAAEGIALINEEIERGGKAAEKTATALNATATATDRLDVSQSEAAASASKEAIALDDVGTSATLAGERASAAASETAEALDGAAVAAEHERAAIERVGAEAGQSGAEATAAIDKLTAAEQEAAAEAAKLSSNLDKTGDEGAKAAADIAKRFTDAGEAIRKSGLSLEVQRAGLQDLVAGANEATVAFIKQGAEGKEGADATGNALIKLKAQLADVNAKIGDEINKLREVGVAGKKGFDDAGDAATRFDVIAEGAFLRVASANETLNTEFRLTPRQLALTVQAVELLKIEMEDMAARGLQATSEQIAKYEALEGEIKQLTATTNKLTNATKDNAVRLKETGNQVQGVASGFQQLASMFGPTGAKIGMLVGNLGQAAGAAENMKDSIAAMDLNKLGGGAAKGGIQLAALAAALAAGAFAGKQFSDQNEENSQAMDAFTREVQKLITVPLSDWVDGANLSLQRWFADPSLDGLLKFLSGYQLLAQDTGTAIRLQTAAMRDGLSETQAAALAAKGGAEAWKFYEQSVKGGAIGHELWTQALRESQGDGAKFLAFIKAHNAELKNAIATTATVTDARKQETEATRTLAAEMNKLDVVLGSASNPERPAAMLAIADVLKKAADESRKLTAAERERLAIIVDIISRGAEMTHGQEQIAEALLGQARAGKEASAAVNALVRLYLQFDIATEGSTKKLATMETVLSTLTQGWNTNADTVRKRTAQAAADMQAALDATDNLTEAQRAHFQQEIDWLNAVEGERERIESLAAGRTARFASDTVEAEKRVRAAIQERLTDLRSYLPLSSQYGQALADTSSEIEDLITSTAGLGRAERERLQIIAELSAKGSEMNAVERQIVTTLLAEAEAGLQTSVSMNALIEARIKLASVTDSVTLAQNGSSAALNLNLQAILDNLAAGEQHSVTLEKLAQALTTELATTDGLTAAQRKRIETIAELSARSEELTAAEKRYVEQLIASVQAGNKREVQYHDLIAAEKARTESIREQIAALQEQIAMQEAAQGATQKQTAINHDQGVSVDYLRQKEAALQRELEQSITVWNASGDAQKKEGNIALERLSRIAEEEKAYERTKTVQQDLIAVQQEGRTVYSNLTAAQQANTDSTIRVVDSQIKVKKSSDDAAEAMRALLGTVPAVTNLMGGLAAQGENLVEVYDRVAKKIREVNAAAEEAADGASGGG